MELRPGAGDANFTIRIPKRSIETTAVGVQKHYSLENGKRFPRLVVLSAIEHWLERSVESVCEDLEELLTSPHLPAAQEFERILENEHLPAPAVLDLTKVRQPTADENYFNGLHVFSKEKLSEVVIRLAESGKDIYKTNLNKLLYYCDMTHFALYGNSISGCTYVHLKHGPVTNKAKQIVNELVSDKVLKIIQVFGKGTNAKMLGTTGKRRATNQILSAEEIDTVKYVLESYGSMTPHEIRDFSHNEKGYASTQRGQSISYKYAKFLQRLPRKHH